MKKFVSRADLEDALKRLDMLILEETQMAVAQVLRASHNTDDTKVESNKTMVEPLLAVADKVAGVIEGERSFFGQSSTKRLGLMDPGGKGKRVVMEQAADHVDQMRRSLSPHLLSTDCGASYILYR